MRNLILAALMCSASISGADEPVGPVVLKPPVRLASAADLAQLRKTNRDHYVRAMRLMTSANRLCKPGEPKLQNADGRDISCAMLLLTSDPPKRALRFTLDSTPYVAIVTVTADRPHLVPAAPR